MNLELRERRKRLLFQSSDLFPLLFQMISLEDLSSFLMVKERVIVAGFQNLFANSKEVCRHETQ